MLGQTYCSKLSLLETQSGIKCIKDYFQKELANELNLLRVSAPLFLKANSGLNDNLNGCENPVTFATNFEMDLQIVHSLAKWKRKALSDYGFNVGEGLYTDMNAIRSTEDVSAIHSIYVDQWDWEQIINEQDRTVDTLKQIVKQIYKTLRLTEEMINNLYPQLSKKLPKDITFITAQELLDAYPTLTPKDREYEICKKHGAVFISQVGKKLSNHDVHDLRAPDYDDWQLNGDILVYHKPLDIALELSSMGIRVNKTSLLSQLEQTNTLDRLTLPYHQDLMHERYPQTVGGGIGQSRLCMFFLEKVHIGEVHCSVWPQDVIETCQKQNIHLL